MKRLVVSVVLLCAITGGGCVRVRANQRGIHSKRSMTNDTDKGEGRFKGHANGAREGADGGNSQPGGGGGCN